MQWAATDQFGNLNIGESDAKTLDDLRPHIASLVEEVHARAGGAFVLTVDLDYTEINGPDPERVSHILRAPDLECFHSDQSPEEILAGIRGLAEEACAEQGIPNAEVNLA